MVWKLHLCTKTRTLTSILWIVKNSWKIKSISMLPFSSWNYSLSRTCLSPRWMLLLMKRWDLGKGHRSGTIQWNARHRTTVVWFYVLFGAGWISDSDIFRLNAQAQIWMGWMLREWLSSLPGKITFTTGIIAHINKAQVKIL